MADGLVQALAAASPQPVPATVPAEQPESFQPVTDAISQQYPGLQPYIDKLAIQRGKPSGPEDDRQLEFYQPWEKENPNPGKLTTELYNKDLKGQDLTETVAGDMLHHLGSVDPSTNKPVDPTWMDMKQRLIGAMGIPQNLMDSQAYQQEKSNPAYETGSFDDWMKNNRSDAYIRGAIFPKQNPEWQEGGIYNPAMQAVTSEMRNYLTKKSQ